MSNNWNPLIAGKARRRVAEHLEVQLLSQEKFGATMNAHKNTIHSWESGRRVPENGMQFIFYKLIEDPSFINEVRRLIGNEQNTGS